MADYHRLRAWTLCHELTLAVYQVTKGFPVHERYGLTSQARRAAFSATANIAEGYARRGRRELRRFLDISLGSLAELAYAIELARDLGYLTRDQWVSLERLRNHAGAVTWRLYDSVRT